MGGNVIVIANDADWKAKLAEAAAAGKTVRAAGCWAPSDGRGACADAPRAALRRWWWTSRPPGAGRAR